MEFSGRGFKYHSGQLSIATSKNHLVGNTISLSISLQILHEQIGFEHLISVLNDESLGPKYDRSILNLFLVEVRKMKRKISTCTDSPLFTLNISMVKFWRNSEPPSPSSVHWHHCIQFLERAHVYLFLECA